jgi:hypothetical protein
MIRRKVKYEQDAELAKQAAAKQLAQKYNIPAELATDPDQVFGIAKSIELQKRTPKERSFEERQFGLLNPQQQDEYRQQKFLGGGGRDLEKQAAQRERIAAQLGLTPGDPAYQSYVATGRMPREDAQPLTATDKKFIEESDNQVQAAETAIANLTKAKELSPRAMGFRGAGIASEVGSVLGNAKSEDTQQLDNLVSVNGVSQLKAIFGANPTEGERAILLDLQGSIGKPDKVRQGIYDRGIELAGKRLELYKQRANQLRGGSFYKPGGGKQTGPAAAAVTKHPSGATIEEIFP